MKRILLLGGYSPAHKRLRELGDYELVLFHYTKSIKTKYTQIYDRIITFEKLNEDQWIDYGVFLNEDTPINRVVTFDDDMQRVAFNISQRIEVPYTYSAHTLELMNDKYKMRNFLQKTHFSKVQSKLLAQEQDLKDCFQDFGVNDVIVKPTDGSASQYIYQVNKNDALPDVYKNIRLIKSTNFVIEPFFMGDEYSVEAYSENGKHVVYCITKKYKNDYFVEVGHSVPADLQMELQHQIVSFVQKMLTTIGITNGPTHTEIIVSQEGIRLVETQSRVGGDMINELYEISTGIDILTLIVRGMLGECVISDINSVSDQSFNQYATIWYEIVPEGKVTDIEIDERINQNPNIHGYRVWCSVGDKLVENRSSIGRTVQAWVSESTAEKSLVLAKEATSYITIKVE